MEEGRGAGWALSNDNSEQSIRVGWGSYPAVAESGFIDGQFVLGAKNYLGKVWQQDFRGRNKD